MNSSEFRMAMMGGCIAALFLLTGGIPVQAATCPEPPNRVIVQVSVKVGFDPASQLYTYSYTVLNDLRSSQEVNGFIVEYAPPIANASSPQGWYGGEYYKSHTFGWDASEVAEPDTVPDDASVPPSIVQIKQGKSLGGFSIQSPKPPGPVKYYVTGHTQPSTVATELDAEQLVEDCPDLQKKILDLAATGQTLGPVDAVPVTIDIKPGSEPNAVNPREQGVVPVAILGAAGFDVLQVDAASVRLGSGQSVPRKEQGHPEDVNRDGFPDFMFHFPVTGTGLRCGDTALFLSGRLRDGRAISGADAVVTVGCR